MKLIKRVGRPDLVTCENCHSELQIEQGDLLWTHCEENCYYVKCPVCGKTIWIKSNDFFDEMWKKQVNSKS